MLLHPSPVVSKPEFETHVEAFNAGIRADGRRFGDSRRLIVETSSQPFATVKLGRTSVTAVSTAKIEVPGDHSPSKGSHAIKLFAPGVRERGAVSQLELYFQMLWQKAGIIEQESLCMRPGEKAWHVTTVIVVYVSLSGLGFPFFDAMTGSLYPPSQRRAHRMAFAVRPVAVTVGFKDGKRVMDPSLLEMQAMRRFATFVFDEHGEQVLVDGVMTGDIQSARCEAGEVARQWRNEINAAIPASTKGLECVGSPADFIGYEPAKFEVPPMARMRELEAFQVWMGSTSDDIVVEFFSELQEASEPESECGTADWLRSSLV